MLGSATTPPEAKGSELRAGACGGDTDSTGPGKPPRVGAPAGYGRGAAAAAGATGPLEKYFRSALGRAAPHGPPAAGGSLSARSRSRCLLKKLPFPGGGRLVENAAGSGG